MKKISRLILPLILMNGIVGCSFSSIKFVSMEVKNKDKYELDDKYYISKEYTSIEVTVESPEQYELNNIIIYNHNIGNDIVYTLDSDKNKCDFDIELINGSYVTNISFDVDHEYKLDKVTNYIELKEINFTSNGRNSKVKVNSNNRLDFKASDEGYNNANASLTTEEEYGYYQCKLDYEKKEVSYIYTIKKNNVSLEIEPKDHIYNQMINGELKSQYFKPFYSFSLPVKDYVEIYNFDVDFKEGHKEIGILGYSGYSITNLDPNINVKLPSTLEKLSLNDTSYAHSTPGILEAKYQYNGTKSNFETIEKNNEWKTNYIKCSDGVVTTTIKDALYNAKDDVYCYFIGEVDSVVSNKNDNDYVLEVKDSTGRVEVELTGVSRKITVKNILVIKITFMRYDGKCVIKLYDIL